MKALHQDEAEALRLASSPVALVAPPQFYEIGVRLAAAGLVRFYDPDLPTCAWAYQVTEAGHRALRVHAAYLGSVA